VKEILEFPGWFVKEDGTVISNEGKIKPTYVSTKAGITCVIFYLGRTPVWRGVAKLVANAYIPNPNGWKYVTYKDGDKSNVHVNNLIYVKGAALLSERSILSVEDKIMYNKTTGEFTYKYGNKVGKNAGCIQKNGYVSVLGEAAGRLAVYLVTGSFPPDGCHVDHKDGNPLNNKWENLRVLSRGDNLKNQFGRGYHRDKRRNSYRAHIRIDGVKKDLGAFSTEEEAREAYLNAKKIYHPTANFERLL
jgi:hypothetical protein